MDQINTVRTIIFITMAAINAPPTNSIANAEDDRGAKILTTNLKHDKSQKNITLLHLKLF